LPLKNEERSIFLIADLKNDREDTVLRETGRKFQTSMHVPIKKK
jgi:hypothetical protein